MAKSKKTRGETPRRKGHMPAKAGKRHLTNWNHPRERSKEQQALMMKGVR